MGPELQIPVELITVFEGKRFKARRLIAALLVLLTSIVVAVIPPTLYGPTDTGNRELTIFDVIGMVVLLAGFLAFCVLLVSFFFRARTVCLTIAPQGSCIEFWKQRKYAQAIDLLVEQIRQRQQTVAEAAFAPAKWPAAYADSPSLTRRFLACSYFAILPALITQQPRWFLLIIFPITWYVFRQAQYLRQPRVYRRAVRCYRRKNWDEAADLLAGLLGRYPDYLPAYLLLVHVHTRSGRFDDALEIIAQYGDTWPHLSQGLHTAAWHCKRVGMRREDNGLPPDPGGSQPPKEKACG